MRNICKLILSLVIVSVPALATAQKKSDPEGFLTYSNILDFDAQMKVGNYAALDRFIASETDFIQTDYVEIVDAYLKERGLR